MTLFCRPWFIAKLYVSNDYLVLYKLRSLPSLRLRRKEWPPVCGPQTVTSPQRWSQTGATHLFQLSETLSTPSTRRTFTNVPRTQNATWVSVSASSRARLLHSFFNKSLLYYNVSFSSRFETRFSLQLQPMRFRHTLAANHL